MTSWRLALPRPDPFELEGVVARRIRDGTCEIELRQFWSLAAHGLGAQEPEDEDLEALDEQWWALGRRAIDGLIAEAPRETRRIQAVVGTFPEGERDYAWTQEQAALVGPHVIDAAERAYRQRLTGVGDASDPSSFAELATWVFRGTRLKERWNDWRRRRALAGALGVPRNPVHEQRIVAAPTEPAPRLLYADWLEDQPRGQGLGAFIELSLAGPERAWRADLLRELEPNVLGSLGPFRVELQWDRGFIEAAAGPSGAWPLLLEHPLAGLLTKVRLEVDQERPGALGPGPYRLEALTLQWPLHHSDPQPLVDFLLANAARFPRLTSLELCSEALPQGVTDGLAAVFPGASVRTNRERP